MKNCTRILSILSLMLLTILMPAIAQTDDNKNKAIVETADGIQQLNTDEISIIRFDGDKVTFVQPWGESVFDRTLRGLTFLRPLPGTLRLTVQAGINENKDNHAKTIKRAQAIDGEGKLKTTWASGDVVYVYADESSTTPLGTLTPAPADYGNNTATLTGDITGTGLSDGTPTLYFSTQPRATYSLATQDGTVESLFYCTATASVTINGGNATISGNLSFTRPFAVVKFSLMDKGNGDAAISASELQVTVNSMTYTVTASPAASNIFVGVPGISGQPVFLKANVGSTVYTYDNASATFADNRYYNVNVKMSEYNALSAPLTFQAMADGVTVKLHKFQTAQPTLQYRKNDGDWTTLTFVDTYNSTSISLNTGDKLSFKGDNTTLTENQNGYCKFELSGNCYVYGNIMSLLDKDDFPTNKTLSAGFTFYELFLNAPIYNHPSKTLVLPATTLTASCYSDMFAGCTHLTTAPALPAATLAASCYKNMFRDCTGLTTAPTLSATTLASECYRNMFGGCTGLTTAPALPATTLASDCYYEMFSGCTGLTTAPTTLPATTLAEYCYSSMFTGCTELTTAPILPATTLKSYCYSWMFDGCTKLNNVTCFATNISASSCTASWLNGVAATGTFTKAESMTEWTTGISGIPSGWTSKTNVVDLSSLTADYVANDYDILTGTLGGNYKITIAAGATVTLRDVTINGVNSWDYEWAGITCLGNATIILEGTNTVTGFCSEYPGIQAAHNNTGVGDEYTLTIQGTGSLTASSNGKTAGIGAAKTDDCGNITISGGTIIATGGDQAAGIGGSNYGVCGNIAISGGTITASGGDDAAGIGSGADNVAACGNISISGGTITATGKYGGAGIGSGNNGASCGNITITSDVTSVTATKGASATNSIGAGKNGTCGTVTIGGTEGAIIESPYTYTPPVPSAPTGAIDGLFSVSSTKQVYFSQGNLQAVFASAGTSCTWQFAEHQYDYIGGRSNGGSEDQTGNNYINGKGSVSNAGTVDLFGWSTNADTNYYGIHNSEDASTYSGDFVDWGNAIGSGWRTLTPAEWEWILGPSASPTPGTNCRISSTVNGVENARYAKATVAGKAGLIIFPDSYTHPGDVTAPESVNTADAAYNSNSYDATAWGKMEAAGAVFLPAAGSRSVVTNNSVQACGVIGGYWSSVVQSDDNAYFLGFQPSDIGPSVFNPKRFGASVRLVKDAE